MTEVAPGAAMGCLGDPSSSSDFPELLSLFTKPTPSTGRTWKLVSLTFFHVGVVCSESVETECTNTSLGTESQGFGAATCHALTPACCFEAIRMGGMIHKLSE